MLSAIIIDFRMVFTRLLPVCNTNSLTIVKYQDRLTTAMRN